MRGNNKKNIVMIADDDLFIRKVISSALKDMAEIIEVTDGSQVEEIYKQHMPDILFLDIHLPNVTGLDLLRKISRTDLGAYIVMISADSTPENVQRSKFQGARAFLTKPFDKKRLLHIFHTCPNIKFHD